MLFINIKLEKIIRTEYYILLLIRPVYLSTAY